MIDRPGHKEEFERLLVERSNEKYVLKLFVTGMTPRSTEAVATIKSICRDLLEGRYELQVVDLYENPSNAGRQQIVVAPTLVKEAPLPVRRLVGDLSNRGRVLSALNLPANERRGVSEP